MSDIKETTATACELKIVTFEQFLAEMPSQDTTVIIQEYNRQISMGNFGGVSFDTPEDDEDVSTYVRTGVKILEPTENNLLSQVIDQVSLGVYTGSEQDRIEAAAVDSLNNFGSPTHVVKLTCNIWGVFNIEDFKYKHLGVAKGAVICYRTSPNIIFRAND